MAYELRAINTEKLADAIVYLIFDQGGRIKWNRINEAVRALHPVPYQFIDAAMSILRNNGILMYGCDHYEINRPYFLTLHNSIAAGNAEYEEFSRLREEYFLESLA